ncbi:hypothetical protein ZYGR_0U03030 [Zygosaccharomyces rouxii]|uniref:Protein YTP1-like C-terminal domain-containing protein n=1 Tax=Zygosaccharomyces rouxii TaxID=4956 RepID=A0A1Q3A455_ZYGRO|nr:hypothetical protein ZYGR_0U03030 [Zygosaccharomyces rouxii]
MSLLWRLRYLLVSLALVNAVRAHGDMNPDNLEGLTSPDIQSAGPRSFHWICTVLFLLLLPSVVTCLTFAGKIYSAVVFQSVGGIYAILEAAIFRFNDNNGIENRTSRGTAWVLALLVWTAIFFGGLASGTSVLIKNKKLQAFVSRTGESKLAYVHRALSFASILAGWVKVCISPVAMFGFCREQHTGQCIAHGIMGSSFILYGFIYTLVLVIPWIRNAKTSYTQDHIDSWIMCIWGIVNTFTEHRWGKSWKMSEYEHTAMGVLWWSGGLLGIFLSRGGRRTFIPSLIIVFTGWAMSQHTQSLVISTKVHFLFGIVLMFGGALRIVEIAFLLKDRRTLDKIQSFQYLPPFCLVCSGVLFMGATEEQLELVLRFKAGYSSYSLLLISGSFMVYLWILICLEFYLHLVRATEDGLFYGYSSIANVHPETEFELDDAIHEEQQSDSVEPGRLET